MQIVNYNTRDSDGDCLCIYMCVCFFLFFLKPFHSDVVLPHTQTHKGTLLGSESSESKSSVSEHLQSKHLCVIVNILLTYFPFCRIKIGSAFCSLKRLNNLSFLFLTIPLHNFSSLFRLLTFFFQFMSYLGNPLSLCSLAFV